MNEIKRLSPEAETRLNQGLRGLWYPVLPSWAVQGTPVGITRLSQHIAVWRDTDGTVHATEDRCPHRGARLSLGWNLGDRVACWYHGIEVRGYAHDTMLLSYVLEVHKPHGLSSLAERHLGRSGGLGPPCLPPLAASAGNARVVASNAGAGRQQWRRCLEQCRHHLERRRHYSDQ